MWWETIGEVNILCVRGTRRQHRTSLSGTAAADHDEMMLGEVIGMPLARLRGSIREFGIIESTCIQNTCHQQVK